MRWLIASLVLAGCNQLLGQESAEQVASLSDVDGDGVLDEQDNCVDVPNADQIDTDSDGTGNACDGCPMDRPTRDRDEDGIDDACDSCLLGPDIDDDGDGVMDACDLCPISPSTTQLDADGDLVGDACDLPTAASNTHAVLDTFATLEPGRWIGLDTWTHDPATTSLIAGPAASLQAAGDASALMTSVAYEIDGDGEVGVRLGDVSCFVRCAADNCTLDFSLTMPIPVPTGPGVMRLYRNPPPMSGPAPAFDTYGCDLANIIKNQGDVTGEVGVPVIEASPGARINGVDLVR